MVRERFAIGGHAQAGRPCKCRRDGLVLAAEARALKISSSTCVEEG